MEGLSSSQLKSYLKNVKDLEVECYQLGKLCDALKSKAKEVSTQSKDLLSENPTNYVKSGVRDFFSDALWWGGVGAVVGAIFGCIAWSTIWLFCLIDGNAQGNIIIAVFEFFECIFTSETVSVPISFFPCVLMGISIGTITGILLLIKSIKQRNKKLPTLKEYTDNRDSIVGTNKKYVLTLLQNHQKCVEKYQETKGILDKYYALNYIYPKYRGIVPICMFYEYLDSGRCTALQGHEGAYNLYESELRMNMIIGKLDEIIYRLDEISSNQRVLAQELRASNTKIERVMRSMASSLDSIQQSSAMTEYYSGITAANTSFMKWYTILNNKGAVLPL